MQTLVISVYIYSKEQPTRQAGSLVGTHVLPGHTRFVGGAGCADHLIIDTKIGPEIESYISASKSDKSDMWSHDVRVRSASTM